MNAYSNEMQKSSFLPIFSAKNNILIKILNNPINCNDNVFENLIRVVKIQRRKKKYI